MVSCFLLVVAVSSTHADFKPLQLRPTERKMSITRCKRQQRMCNVWYMIRKGTGRQPDNTCYLVLIDLSQKKNCICYCYLIRSCRPIKKIHLFVRIAAGTVSLSHLTASLASHPGPHHPLSRTLSACGSLYCLVSPAPGSPFSHWCTRGQATESQRTREEELTNEQNGHGAGKKKENHQNHPTPLDKKVKKAPSHSFHEHLFFARCIRTALR